MLKEADSINPYDLQRFVDAQASVFEQVRAELTAGRKSSHWMWFIFPQVYGLGSSPMARRYAISGYDEAAAYLAHPVLGRRLRDCTCLVNDVQSLSIREIFGTPDDLKFHSSVTLFSVVVARDDSQFRGENHVFSEAINRYCRSAGPSYARPSDGLTDLAPAH